MTYNVQSFEDDTLQRHYDNETDRLFLVYYALPPGFNANKWGVSDRSLDVNIKSAVNKPVIIYRKNPNLSFHTHQAGNFVHPTIEEASAELGHPPNEKEYYQWQEKFAVGRVRSVDKRSKGYAWTLEITDPDSKQILKDSRYSHGIPGWTSPQILSNAYLYPEEEKRGIFDHWSISHVILTDKPAYGFDKASLKAKCIGEEQTCLIKTKSASQQENLGFCVKQATIDLVNVHSSHVESINNSSHTTMSANETQPPSTQQSTGETVVTSTIAANNTNPTPSSQPQQQEQPITSQAQPVTEDQPAVKEEQLKVSNLEEANTTIGQMSTLIKDLQKTVKLQGKELERINVERKQARLSYIIPRDLFKSDESHAKEVQKTMSENVSEQWLMEFWKTKRELALMQHNQPKMEQPLMVKSASTSDHDVPDFSSSNKTTQRSVIDKQLELQRMILEGGSY